MYKCGYLIPRYLPKYPTYDVDGDDRVDELVVIFCLPLPCGLGPSGVLKSTSSCCGPLFLDMHIETDFIYLSKECAGRNVSN